MIINVMLVIFVGGIKIVLISFIEEFFDLSLCVSDKDIVYFF